MKKLLTLVVAIAMLAAPSSAGATILGYYTDRDVSALPSALGVELHGWRENANWMKAMPPKHVVEAFDRGQTFSYHAQGWEMPWRQVPNDPDLRAALIAGFHAIADNGRWSHETPYYLAPEHELAVSHAGTGKEYRRAFRWEYNLAASLGLTYNQGGPIAFVYTPTLSSYRAAKPSAAAGYPGNAYVNVIGVDAYNKRQSDGMLGQPDADAWIAPVVAFARQHGKPWLFGEIGIGPGDDRAAFIRDLHGAIVRAGGCLAMLYSDVGETLGKQRYYVTDDQASLDAMRELAADPEFQSVG